MRRAAGCSIDRIAVGIGPGSFTGLRIGIATTRALAQASGTPIAPVGTLSALARGVSAQAGGDGALALPVIDARRGEVFAALIEGDGSEVWPPFVATPNQVADRVRELDRAPLAAGDGALRFAAQLEAAGATVAPPEDPIHRVAATARVRDRGGGGRGVTGPDPTPVSETARCKEMA